MNTTINLCVNQQGTLTYMAQLSHNKKRELFFRVLWNHIKPSYFYDGLVDNEQDIKNIDHISFHEDGTIHLSMRESPNNQSTLFHEKLVNTIATMPPDGYGALVIFSIYDFATAKNFTGKPTPLTFTDSKNVDLQFEVETTNQFSFVFFLVGQQVDVKLMLQSKFPSVFNPGNSICIKDYLLDENGITTENEENKQINVLQLLIAYTEKVIQRPKTDLLASPRKLKQFNRVENLFGFNIASSDDKIRRLV